MAVTRRAAALWPAAGGPLKTHHHRQARFARQTPTRARVGVWAHCYSKVEGAVAVTRRAAALWPAAGGPLKTHHHRQARFARPHPHTRACGGVGPLLQQGRRRGGGYTPRSGALAGGRRPLENSPPSPSAFCAPTPPHARVWGCGRTRSAHHKTFHPHTEQTGARTTTHGTNAEFPRHTHGTTLHYPYERAQNEGK